MSKKILFLLFFVVIYLFSSKVALAQTSTSSAATSSAATSSAATQSAISTPSATVLPKTGANDVLVLVSAGLIFIFAGLTVLTGTKKVFNDLE